MTRKEHLKIAFLIASALFGASVAPQDEAAGQSSRPDYSRFKHESHRGAVRVPGTLETRTLGCDSCHERRAAGGADLVATTPRNRQLALRFPGHSACVGCHVAQFTAQPPVTCTICHDREQALSARPPQRDFPARYDFNLQFDVRQHASHMKHQFAGGRRLECAFCHQPTPQGAARLIPSHPECYACHAPGTGLAPAESKAGCAVCHAPSKETVAPRDYRSRAYGARFSHQTHVGYVNGECTACHTIEGGYHQPSPKPGTIRIKEHGRRDGRGCFSCHDGGQHYGRKVFSGEFGAAGEAACAKCHRDDFKVFSAPG
jgi:hypothetical protein